MSSFKNPFLTGTNLIPELYFGRENEIIRVVNEITSGNNVSLIAPPKIGKKSLIKSVFSNRDITRSYFTFFIDIRTTRSMGEFVLLLSRTILEGLKPFGKNIYQEYIDSIVTLKPYIIYDSRDTPSLNISLDHIDNPGVTLDEIFNFLDETGKPCIIAIDEFQYLANFPGKNILSTFRTYIQHCKSARFIFSGSQVSQMEKIFTAHNSPFYQSTSVINLGTIPANIYSAFAFRQFTESGFEISADVIFAVYEKFEGITWYMQKIMHTLYSNAVKGTICTMEMLPDAINETLDCYDYTYSDLMLRIPEKQKELLIAVSKEGKVNGITSGGFVKKYNLPSQSSVQAALKGLIEKEYITRTFNPETKTFVYSLADKFLELWLNHTLTH
jgi:hypothetical protein